MNKPTKLKMLDDLIAQAAHYAEFCMRNSAKMAPTLFLIGTDGPMMIAATSLDGTDELDAFVAGARLLCIAETGEPVDMTEAPAQAFDRQQVVVLMGESHTGHKQRFLQIIRSGNGQFFGLNEIPLPETERMNGRFAQILSPAPRMGIDSLPGPCCL